MNMLRDSLPPLTVLLVTYNHEPFVARAIESALRQSYPGPLRLLVADDASTDRTLEIVAAAAGRRPDVPVTILPAEPNMGITRNYRRAFAACDGEYVAVLEGDDHWTSPYKLARQVEFLQAHWESDLCSTNYWVHDERSADFRPRMGIGTGHRFLTAQDLVRDNIVGNFSTCVYRRAALERLPPELFEIRSYDWAVNLCVALHGPIGFLDEPMSVYRLHAGGAWTQTGAIERVKIQRALIDDYDRLTGGVLHGEFQALATHLDHLVSIERHRTMGAGTKARIRRVARGVADITPPVLTALARGLTPPRLARLLATRLFGGPR
jgi:glycosyltransferase involved in cell wall biosynthesis